jgi:FkbM family methyltransferase
MVGRAAVCVLPDRLLHPLKKAYYCRLVRYLPKDFLETDALLVKHLVSAGHQVVDVGASIGCFTKLLSELVGELGRVYSFEPTAPTFDFLSNNVQRLGLQNVELFNCAVSDTEGTGTMVIPTYRWGSECYYDARLETAQIHGGHKSVNPSWRSLQVRTRILDSFFGNGGTQISFIKCDADFHELAILRGALRTLRHSKPALLIEIAPNPDDQESSAFETFALLRSEGYQPYCFDGTTLHPRRLGERSQNYFFLTPSHVAALQEKGVLRLLGAHSGGG